LFSNVSKNHSIRVDFSGKTAEQCQIINDSEPLKRGIIDVLPIFEWL